TESLASRTKVSASLPLSTMTALYLTSLVLQKSISFRFLGTFISGALPENSTTPLIVAVPILPSAAFFGSSFLGAVVAIGLALLAVGFGSSGQPTPMVRARALSAAIEARSRGRI